MKFAVCDDESEITDYIAERLREYYPDECEIQKYTDGKTLLSDSKREDFDAFFLDVGMPELDGMALAERIREFNQHVKIIFLINNNELAHMGYIYDAFRYIRKSKLEKELYEAAKSLNAYFSKLDEYLNFKTPDRIITRSVNSIRYFEVNGHTVTMICDQCAVKVCGTMRLYEERLKDMGFIRVHKSYLVNMGYIDSIQKNTVKLSNDEVLPLSRTRADIVKKKLLDFSKNSSEIIK